MSDGGMKEMAELLRSGATMMSQSCPECGSPLFRLKSGDIWCAKCRRQVVIVKEGEEAIAEAGAQLVTLEKTLVDKLSSMEELLSAETDLDRLLLLAEVVDALLVSLERLRRIRKG
ncbi:MAG TPA: Sjogren's syndrome/scleroderma autoantigen 1 family protein [Patescibacteria group bacterium]|nr:Sjogren's syndrome/scleroderma autoantigen 1 family protein [Patescibacteria group bacterium]